MKTIVFIFCLSLFSCSPTWAETIGGYTVNEYVEAIYKAEGGRQARFPYGIRSVNCEGKKDCENIARNTVINNFRRWKNSGKKVEYLQFLANRYCPVNGKLDNGTCKNWEKNVTYFLEKNHGNN